MKKIYSFIIVNILCINLYAQNFDWTKREGQSEYDYGYGIANDVAGNIYVAGKYERTANFSGTILPLQGNHDIYLAKYSATGALTWIRTGGGVNGDYAHSIACDGSNFVYIAGEIEGVGTQIKFNGSPITLISKGINDAFFAKYDLNGNLLWARSAGGTDNDEALGITYDNAGNIYICGFFNTSATFGTTTITSRGNNDIYIAKYDMDGVFQWVRSAGSAGRDEAKAIKCDAAGNIYMCGMYSNATVFGSQTLNAPNGYFNTFIAKYSPDGTLAWVKTAGGDYDDLAWALTIDNSNNIYITGEFNAYAIFSGTPLITTGSNNVFVACYDASGNMQWVKGAGGPGIDRARGIGTDGTHLYITGQFDSTATFGPYSVAGVDHNEIFIAKMSNTGNFQWVTTVGGPVDSVEDLGYESGIGICAEASGNIYATGALLNGGVFGTNSFTPYSRVDVFVSKILQNINPPVCSDPANLTVMASKPASFTVSATGGVPFNYQWQKNGVNIAGATSPSYSIINTQFTHAGQYRVIVSNIYGIDTSTAATLTVIPFNADPIATIITPSTGTFYHAGDVINFSGTGTDAEDGTLAASAFQWRVDFYVNDTNFTQGPIISPGISSGSFVVPNTGNPSATVFYRLKLKVTDSNGLSGTAFVDILPITSTITINTQPPGLQITYDSVPKITPFSALTVEGLQINIGTVSPQIKVELSYSFSNWQHGGSASQTISVGSGDSSYTAVYNSTGPACIASGTIGREFWANVTGSTIASIPVNTLPTSTSQLSIFEGPSQAGDNYGSRIRGYICPPETGNYIFWIASDDNSELWLSTDDKVINKVKIASVSGYTSSRQWTKYPVQQSLPISLIASAKYYIEAIHREGSQGDNLAVGWQLPNGAFERPIPGLRLAPFTPPIIATITLPANNTFFNVGSIVSIQSIVSGGTGTIQKVEFFAGTTKLGEDLTSPYTFSWNNPPAGLYALTAKATDNGNNTSVSTAINISVINPLSVTISSPANNSSFNSGSIITIQANSSGGTGTIQKVEFYAGTVKLGEDLTPPFSFVLNNSTAGNYALTAKATDSGNNVALSGIVNILVIDPLTASIIAPVNNSSFDIDSIIKIEATVSGGVGTIQKVEFFAGTTKLGESSTSPYKFIWNNAGSGLYSLTAKVTDSGNNSAVSGIINVTVNAEDPLTTTITAPSTNSSFNSGSAISIQAVSSGGISPLQKVEFFAGSTKLGESITAPYNFTWNNAPAGSHALTAKATDNVNISAVSPIINVTVKNPPVATITSPANNTSYPSPANITINATATSSGGSIAKIEFYQGSIKIGEDLSTPYNFTWMNVSAGNYTLKAIATDNLGQPGTSQEVNVIVTTCSTPVITPSGPLTMCSGSVTLQANTGSGFLYQWKKDGVNTTGATNSALLATEGGSYQVKIIQGSCISWSAPVIVKIQSGLNATITPGGSTTFCSGGSVKLFGSTCIGNTYLWKKNGSAIPGATADTYTATTSGTYQLQITKAGVNAWSSLVTVTVNVCRELETIPVAENNQDQLTDSIKTFQMKVYPNPNTGLFTIELNMPFINEEKVKLKIVNIVGQEVYHKGLAAKDENIKEVVELDKSLPPGIYILQVTIGNKMENTNMILAR
ncbi:MAG: Ig-like domain-containing protein [Bacteroidota bacterium]